MCQELFDIPGLQLSDNINNLDLLNTQASESIPPVGEIIARMFLNRANLYPPLLRNAIDDIQEIYSIKHRTYILGYACQWATREPTSALCLINNIINVNICQ